MTASNQDKRQLEAWKIRLICAKCLSPDPKVRETARNMGLSPNTVVSIRSKARLLGYSSIEEITSLSDEELIRRFYPASASGHNTKTDTVDKNNKYVPDFAYTARMMLEKKIDSNTAYNEYRELTFKTNALPFSKGYFCRRLSAELKELTAKDDYYFKQDFVYGQVLQIDFTGDTYNLLTHNGMVRCWIMVLTWPASYYTYAAFVSAQSTAESCRVISNAVRFWGNRVPSILVCDNAKAFVLVHKGSHIVLNQAFSDFMSGLGICVDAAPVRHPQVKSACEYSVSLVQRLASRKVLTESFAQKKTLDEHSKFLQKMVDENINQGPFRNSIDKTRSYLFNTYELPATRCVSSIPEYAREYTTLVVPRSYYIRVKEHEYSVPYQYIGKAVDVFVGNDYIVIKFEGQEIARHLRTDTEGRTCCPQHMPPEHQSIIREKEKFADETSLLDYAKKLCPELYNLCARKLSLSESSGANRANALKSCKGMINFYVKHEAKDLIAICCTSLLAHSPHMWNTPCLKEIYIQKTNQLFADSKRKKYDSEEIVRTSSDQAYLRKTDDGDDELI